MWSTHPNKKYMRFFENHIPSLDMLHVRNWMHPAYWLWTVGLRNRLECLLVYISPRAAGQTKHFCAVRVALIPCFTIVNPLTTKYSMNYDGAWRAKRQMIWQNLFWFRLRSNYVLTYRYFNNNFLRGLSPPVCHLIVYIFYKVYYLLSNHTSKFPSEWCCPEPHAGCLNGSVQLTGVQSTDQHSTGAEYRFSSVSSLLSR